jgi:hypothetical protein
MDAVTGQLMNRWRREEARFRGDWVKKCKSAETELCLTFMLSFVGAVDDGTSQGYGGGDMETIPFTPLIILSIFAVVWSMICASYFAAVRAISLVMPSIRASLSILE